MDGGGDEEKTTSVIRNKRTQGHTRKRKRAQIEPHTDLERTDRPAPQKPAHHRSVARGRNRAKEAHPAQQCAQIRPLQELHRHEAAERVRDEHGLRGAEVGGPGPRLQVCRDEFQSLAWRVTEAGGEDSGGVSVDARLQAVRVCMCRRGIDGVKACAPRSSTCSWICTEAAALGPMPAGVYVCV